MILSPNQIAEILKIIEKYHIVFTAGAVGQEVLSTEDKRILNSSGIDLKRILSSTPTLEEAFKFGMLSDAIGEAKAKKLTYAEFQKFLKSGQFIPLTSAEKARLNVLKNRTYGDIRVLGNRISDQTRNIILEEGQKAISEHKSVRQMALEIGKRTGNWKKDFDRVSDYVMHTAFNEGRAESMKKQGRGERVYFSVYEGGCKHCIRLYLTNGIGSRPRVFTVDELKANGTNIGLKVADWKPTLGPIHPWCRCTINWIPKGYVWNEETQSFDKPSEFKRKVERKSKVKVTVGDKTTEV